MATDIQPDPDEMQAAEYVLGTLAASERKTFEQRLAGDAGLRGSVAGWEKRLGPLAAAVPARSPPPGLWRAIEAALPPASARPKLELIHGTGGADKLRAKLVMWRRMAGGAAALAAMLAVALIGREATRPASQSESFVAAVNRGGDLPALIVRVDMASGNVFVRPVAAQTPENKSLELWYIGEGSAPKSMGVVAGDPLKLVLPASAAGDALGKAVFAVTLEPKGGSPSGDPTGAVVYKGQLIKE